MSGGNIYCEEIAQGLKKGCAGGACRAKEGVVGASLRRGSERRPGGGQTRNHATPGGHVPGSGNSTAAWVARAQRRMRRKGEKEANRRRGRSRERQAVPEMELELYGFCT